MDIALQLRIILDVAGALVLGGLIGLERESAHKPAGFRTHMLVAGAAALLMALGDPLLSTYQDHVAAETLRADPIRLFEAIVTGIGFIYSLKKREVWSAGVNNMYSQIMHKKQSSKGLKGFVLA